MIFAYADPPYPGCATRYPEKQEVDHAELIRWLFEVLNVGPEDEVVDLFPGTGNLARCLDSWRRQVALPLRETEQLTL